MIEKEICEKVLTMGCEWQRPLGGVARVLHSYSNYIFRDFNFIKTTKGSNICIKIITFINAIVSLVCYCILSKIEIVHIHGSSYNSFRRKRILIRIAKLFNKKVLYHIHGGEYDAFYRKNKVKVQATLNKVDAIITLSDSWKDFFINEVGYNEVFVLPNITPFCPPKKNFISRDIKNVLFVGTLCQGKGVYDIIKMCVDHQSTLRNRFVLYLCGNGEVNEVRSLVDKHDISDIVTCTGAVDYATISDMLNNSDVFILPSYNEGLPISILEAMAHSLPVISTPVGGIPEVVTNGINGYLIAPGNTDQLYRTIETIVSDDNKRKLMGEASYLKVQSHFPDSVALELSRIYTTLLDS